MFLWQFKKKYITKENNYNARHQGDEEILQLGKLQDKTIYIVPSNPDGKTQLTESHDIYAL